MQWVVFGLLYALFNSAVIFLNEKFKLNPSILGIYRGFGSFILIIPFMFFTPVPHNTGFWLFAILQGLLVGFFDYKLFKSSAQYGASGTAMMTVLAIVLSIFAWWFIDISRLEELIHRPLLFLGIILSILGCVKGFMSLSGSSFDKTLLKYMWPAIIVLAFMTINSKNITSRVTLEQSSVYYVVIIGIVGGLFNLASYFIVGRHNFDEAEKTGGALPQRHSFTTLKADMFNNWALKGGLIMVVCSTLLMVTKNIAMRHIPNPGFLNILALTSPLWIILFNHFAKIHTRISLKAAVFTLICMGLLVFFSGLEYAATPY